MEQRYPAMSVSKSHYYIYKHLLIYNFKFHNMKLTSNLMLFKQRECIEHCVGIFYVFYCITVNYKGDFGHTLER